MSCPAPLLDGFGNQLAETSTLEPWIVHVLFIAPPVLGLVWTLICHLHVSGIEVTCDEDSGDEGETTELFNASRDEGFQAPMTEDELLLVQGGGYHDDGTYTDKMNNIAQLIKDGALTFLYQEYLWMAVYIVIMSILIGVFYYMTNPVLLWGTVGAFIIGAVTSILCGYIGMQAAVNCNVRTTFYCWKFGAMQGLDVSLRGGCIMGFGLCSIGVLVLYGVIMLYRSVVYQNCPINICEALAGFGLGGSSIALFGRVGGGIYTKAADVGADLSGKIDQDMPEDSPYNPACIADNVGDNVGDIAGMGADLFGSFAESTVAALVIAASVTDPVNGLANNFSGLYFPVLVSSSGICVGFFTILVILNCLGCLTSHGEDISGIERALKWCLIVSTLLQTPVIIALGLYCLPPTFLLPSGPATPWDCIIPVLLGLWSGLIIGLVTEYYTSHSYSPVRDLASSQVQSAATGIIFGLALGYLSCIVPVVLLAIIIVSAHTLAGMYGIALAALGMLSTLTVGLTIDAYGPISDNAGGIAEMAELNEEVRNITDALDAAGNTTAAIGKGFAIGSAALVGLALFGAFKVRAEIGAVDVAEPWTFAGLLIGALLPYAFSAMTMKSVALAANQMVEECREQIPLILERKRKGEDPDPDYEKCIKISTEASLREMILPGLLVILSPLVMGLAFGKNCCAGLLCGALVSGVQLAISMSNSGGAWDNSKKFIKAKDSPFLALNGLKKTDAEFKEAHKNSVTGDTVGDPLKDTSGPSLNILVKLSAITSLVFAGVIRDWSNAAGGPYWVEVPNASLAPSSGLATLAPSSGPAIARLLSSTIV